MFYINQRNVSNVKNQYVCLAQLSGKNSTQNVQMVANNLYHKKLIG